MGEFSTGQPVARLEDLQLLRGNGRFVDDGAMASEVHAYCLRAPHAHATLRAIATGGAEGAPGVLAVLTGRDYRAANLGDIPHIGPPLKRRDGSASFVPPFAPLAVERVRFVGEVVALVVAETLAEAKDAAELIEVDYGPLGTISTTANALDGAAAVVWDENQSNECFVHEVGDREATEAAFSKAARIVRGRFDISRVHANPMEPRGCLGEYDQRTGRYMLVAPIQHPFVARQLLAQKIFGVAELDVRVVAGDVGGSFGARANIYPEYVLALWASRHIGRPVRWLSERSEGQLSDFHGRDNLTEAELALDADARFLGLRVKTLVNLGAYLSPLGSGPAINNLGTLAGIYTTQAARVEVTGVFTHSTPTAPYRGAGRPEAAYVIERMVDLAARELGIDAVELRRRNMIPPSAMPYKTALTFTYDNGEFERNIDDALRLADVGGFDARRDAARHRGKLRGLGIAYAIERAAPPGLEYAEIRFDPSGTATVLCGTTSQGQGHATTYTQLLCDRLGLPPETFRVIDGDSDRVAFGLGSGGSRCSALGSAAVLLAADKVIEKAQKIAAHALEAAESDISFDDGRYVIAGTDRALPFIEAARRAFVPANLPADVEPGLYESATYRSTVACYPNGCHACEIEIDTETGEIEILRYLVVDDFGNLINPLLVKGQVHGGVVQGVGQALMEDFVYDSESGQALAGSFMDYCMPRADDLCLFDVESNPVPTATNPLGVKGAGEAGTVGALPVVMNAVVDALSPLGIRHIDMPATPERVWRAIAEANGP